MRSIRHPPESRLEETVKEIGIQASLSRQIIQLFESDLNSAQMNDLGVLCFLLNDQVRLLDLERVRIVQKREYRLFSFAQSVAIAVNSYRYFDVFDLTLTNSASLDYAQALHSLSRLAGVRHFIVRAKDLDSTFFSAIRDVSIRHLEIKGLDIENSSVAMNESFRKLAKYLASNPPLEKLSVYGNAYLIRVPEIDTTTQIGSLIRDYGNKQDSRSEHEMYQALLAAVETEIDGKLQVGYTEEYFYSDPLSAILGALSSNNALKVRLPASS